MLLSLISASFLAAPAALPQVPAPTAGAQEAPVDVTEPIRAGLRWLRSTQDPVTGAYAANLETTALVVRAFAESPDRYRATDGPFVKRAVEFLLVNQREDGSFGPIEGDDAA